MTTLQIIAVILALQLLFNAFAFLSSMKQANAILKRLLKRGDVEQDIELYDDAFIDGITIYLNDQWLRIIADTNRKDRPKYFTDTFLLPANELPKVSAIGQFSLSEGQTRIVFDEWTFRDLTPKN